MINLDFTISMLNANHSRVEWDSPNASDVSFVYVNGFLKHGPIYGETIKRSATIRFTKTLNKCIEIHDFPTNIGETKNVCIRELQRPSIQWNHNPNALRYRIFHTPFGGSESQIAEITVRDDREKYILDSPIRLVDGWHFFRVESVRETGVESVRLPWNYRAFRIPKPVNNLTVANGSGAGLFDITIS